MERFRQAARLSSQERWLGASRNGNIFSGQMSTQEYPLTVSISTFRLLCSTVTDLVVMPPGFNRKLQLVEHYTFSNQKRERHIGHTDEVVLYQTLKGNPYGHSIRFSS